MDQYALIATVLWTGLFIALLAAAATPSAARHAGHPYALLLLFVATVYTLFFAILSGFSIGRQMALIPVLLTAWAIAFGRGWKLVVTALAIGAATYYAFSWLLTPILFAAGPDSPLAVVLGGWGIPLYAALAPAGFIWAAFNPPPPRMARAR